MQLKNFRARALGQTGDTIIEVLIAVAVCGFALGGAYVAVNHAIVGVENQQEHNQAIKLVESQVEDLRSYTDSSDYTGGNINFNCFVYDSGSKTIKPAPPNPTQGNNPCIVQNDGSQAPAGTEPAFNLSITSIPPQTVSSPTTFIVNVQWHNLEGTTSQTSMDYRPQ